MTREEISDWIAHPVTVQMMEAFKDVKSALEDSVINGRFIDDPTGYAKAVGQIEGISFFINVELEETDDED